MRPIGFTRGAGRAEFLRAILKVCTPIPNPSPLNRGKGAHPFAVGDSLHRGKGLRMDYRRQARPKRTILGAS
jgi:hypothetical protein